MEPKKTRNIFVQGAISPEFISAQIHRHAARTGIGAHSIFLGQVREDRIERKTVVAIDYTAYEEMSNERMHMIREDIFSKFDLTCMHVYHSLGKVNTGKISLFVFASAPHRKAAIDACEETVERIKKELPIWGREILSDETHQWKREN